MKDAGFDAVEGHGAHGYLISQFLSPLDSMRTDEYGGSVEKRARFVCEVLAAIRKTVGSDYPILLRISGSDFMPGGITIEDSVHQSPLFVEAGADALHISASQQASIHWQYPSYLFPKGPLVHLVRAVKEVVKVPVIVVGKLGDPYLAEQVLKEKSADFIALARPLMADPQWPNKVMEGRIADINHCINCLNCFNFMPHLGYVLKWGVPYTVNPAKLRERNFTARAVYSSKRVMVVGGGLAGMEAARVLSLRGHEVDLYEQSSLLGGQWHIACLQPQKKVDYLPLLDKMIRDLKKSGARIYFNTEVMPELVKKVNPDAVVVATGAQPITPKIRGGDGKNVVQAIDVVLGKVDVPDRIVVAGGRYLGMKIADELAIQGKEVYLVTRSLLGRDMERNIFLALRDRLIEKGVSIFQNSPLVEVRDDGVYIAFNGDLVFLGADMVILAAGMKSRNRLFDAIKGSVSEVYNIGDSVMPRDAMAAIREGAEIGRLI